jgi:hypothetical protein
LFLSAAKTKLLHGREVEADFEDSELRAAKYWFDVAGYRTARPILKKIIRKAFRKDGTLATNQAKFSLWRLTLLRDEYALRLVLQRLEDLAPIASIVAAYLTPWISRARVEHGLRQFLWDPERNTSPFLSVWLMAAMLERSGAFPDAWASYGRKVARDKNEPVHHRAIASSVMARSGESADVAWLKRELKTEWDPALIRAYLTALARTGQLDKTDADRVSARIPELEVTTSYLRGRRSLRSLIYRGESVLVR